MSEQEQKQEPGYMKLHTVEKHPIPFNRWLESMPVNKAPALLDFANRWDEIETIETRDAHGHVTGTTQRKKEVGEQRAYVAFLTGVMEPAEAYQFGMLSVRIDALVTSAIVPLVRHLWQWRGGYVEVAKGYRDSQEASFRELGALYAELNQKLEQVLAQQLLALTQAAAEPKKKEK